MRKFGALLVVSTLAFACLYTALGLLHRPAFGHAGTPSPTVWSSGQTLTAQALNDTIAHIHNTFTGAIVDAHISGAASIQHSKLQFPTLIPQAFAKVGTTSACSSGTCTLGGSLRVSSVTRTGAGTYTVNLLTGASANTLAVMATNNEGATSGPCNAHTQTATTSFTVTCLNSAGAATDSRFTVVAWWGS